MSVIVKKKVFDLLQNEQKNFYEWVAYFLDSDISSFDKQKAAVRLLTKELENVNITDLEFPATIENVKEWYFNDNKAVCETFQNYLGQRRAGAERQYFKNIGQAFEFLIKVSPIKKVDGSWLYSMVNYWNDPAFHDLIVIYLEELGAGQAKANHVCIYDDLLRVLGLDDFELFLEDEYYQQAAIQLALGYAPAEFIPEIIGFNLGYEQLPLHLLITNYELKELGIDSKYFNLHITIDNLDNGHAHKSIRVLEKMYKEHKDKVLFIEKVKRGYALNQHGINSTQIIQNLNLENFVHKILKRKALVGQLVHNEQHQIGCKTVNQWLSKPEEIGSFISQLIEKKWIKLNEDPEKSLFWRLISHEDGKMYGVFNPTEQQIIHDWIAGDQYASNFLPFHQHLNKEQHIQNYLFSYISDGDLEQLQQQVNQSSHLAFKIGKLIPFLAPDSHHKSIGLWCTQKYTELLFPYLANSKQDKGSI